MKIFTRPLAFLALVTASAVLLSGVVVVGSALAAPPVTVSVDVKEDGLRIWIPVPSLWLTTAARLAPIERHLGHLDGHFDADHRGLLVGMLGVVDALDGGGDAVLVHVETPEELVEIATLRGRLTVRVRSADADVDVAVPISTLRSVVGRW